MENNQQSFYQFSDQLRVHTNNMANLSLNDSIWSSSYTSKRPEERRNFDIRVGGELNSVNSLNSSKPKEADFNGFNQSWKLGGSDLNGNDGWNSVNPLSNLKQNEPDFNGLNHGWKIGGSDLNGNDGWNSVNPLSNLKQKEPDFNGFNHGWKIGGSDFNGFNDGWKLGSAGLGSIGSSQQKMMVGLNGGFNKGIYSKPSMNYNLNNNVNNFNVAVNTKGNKNGTGKGEDDHHHHHHGFKTGKKNKNNNSNKDKNNSDNNSDNNSNKNSVDKRFKTLPPSESLPRNETVGGYIFVCNNDTMQENLKRQLFGLPPRYRDSVRAITPGLPLFLYNYSTHQLHGVFEAASFGGTNFDPTAWEDKKNPGESRFPAQVRVLTRKICEPLEEDSFRPILHHYDGPKFRLELNIPEALSLLDIFEESN